MGMFDNYDNLSPDYIPDNSSPKVVVRQRIYDTELPKKLFNIRGKFIGYLVNEGDTYNLDLGLECKVLVEVDALHFTQPGDGPTKNTSGYVGKKAYNTTDIVSYICSEVVHNTPDTIEYIWTKEDKFTYPSIGEVLLYFHPYGEHNIVEVSILNFRGEIITTICLDNQQAKLVVDKELSDLLPQGTYTVQVVVQNESSRRLVTKIDLIVGSVDMTELNKSSVSGAIYSNSSTNFITEKLNTIMAAVQKQSERLDETIIEVTETLNELS